jgi:ribulose-phosphate 3-epimerase
LVADRDDYVKTAFMKIKIAPSILSADFGRLNEEIASVEKYSDMIHVDVMDGHFVPNITIGAPVVKWLKTKLPLNCHLMIEHPERFLEDFAKAGAHTITVHQEVCPHLGKVLQQIKDLGCKAGVSINPSTPVEMLEEVIDDVDEVLIMSVNPGFGGQSFIESALGKIAAVREMSATVDIMVDGGINAETGRLCVEAGANILVAGSYIFGAKDRKKAIESLRG